jgi:hypothetical protein
LDYREDREVEMDLQRTNVLIKPNNARVLVRPFEFSDSQRALRIVARVMSLTAEDVDRLVPRAAPEGASVHHASV